MSERLADFTRPALVIVGARDRVLPPETGIEVARRIADAELVEFPRSGHLGYAEQPEAFNAGVAKFLSAAS